MQRRPECRVQAVETAARVMAGQAFQKFLPLFDRVLVERSAAETVTKGGIMLPEKSQGKVLQATVVAVGSGAKGKVTWSGSSGAEFYVWCGRKGIVTHGCQKWLFK